jgi:RNA polymerase sigma factor (TIGR02999 family)
LTDDKSKHGEVTVLLREWAAGKPDALDRLFELVYPDLRRIAGSLFRGERPGHLLQPTSVVNELFLKLIRQRSLRFQDREHFYSLSARLMRRVLMDHARSQLRDKRDGGISVPFEEVYAPEFLSPHNCLMAISLELKNYPSYLKEGKKPAQVIKGRGLTNGRLNQDWPIGPHNASTAGPWSEPERIAALAAEVAARLWRNSDPR